MVIRKVGQVGICCMVPAGRPLMEQELKAIILSLLHESHLDSGGLNQIIQGALKVHYF